MFRTIGAAIGAAVVLLLLATVASKLTSHVGPVNVNEVSAARR